MGTFKNGVLGGFSGKVGSVVGATWKGQNVMKIIPASVSNPRTPRQQAVRSRFSMMGHFLSTQRRLVSVGFKAYADTSTSFNAAMKYNLAHAIAGEYPDLTIDFSQARLSMGQLPVPSDLVAVVSSDKSITLNWTDNSSMELASAGDILMVGVYDAETGSGYTLSGSYKRSDATGLITLPDNWAGRTVELFVFMVSPLSTGETHSKEMVSETLYMGSLLLTG
ncbi:MAG: hypothetical protein IH595_15050 [Bacteroidales bacterium]|nr:hypothetical protein [Bacteroidales bacterium]